MNTIRISSVQYINKNLMNFLTFVIKYVIILSNYVTLLKLVDVSAISTNFG